ncbi:MAG: hypothetical protein OXN96_20580 [Bryobacterales bacterium]|nr:hypothetical protein [Bryobacterales bacterium]
MTEGLEDRAILSHWRRCVGMLFEPRRVMEDLSSQPRWIFPILLSQVPSAIFFTGLWFQPSALSLLLREGDSFGSLAKEIGAIFLTVFVSIGAGIAEQAAALFLSALVLAGLMRALSCALSIRHSLALVSYSLVPGILIGFVHSVFRLGVSLLELDSPLPHGFWLNAAVFFDRSETHVLVYSIASQIGVFPLWRWLLVALGITIVLRSVSFRIALGATVAGLVLIGSIHAMAATYFARLVASNLP